MSMPPRPYHHGRLRDALLETAEAALESSGAQGLTLRELSRALGVSHSSPRRHFADRQALLDALAQRGFERLGDALRRATADRNMGFDARLRELARGQTTFATKHPAMLALMLEAKQRAEAPPELLQAGEDAYEVAVAVLKDGQADGSVVGGDPERLGLVGYAAMQGLIAMSSGGAVKGTSLDLLVDEVVERLVLGMRPRPEP